MSPELKHTLKQVLAGRGRVDMGQFRFLGLDRVREAAGEDWPRLRDKVYEAGGHFIEKRLASDDAVIRCRGGFLIIFKRLEGDGAASVVAEISAGLERFFLGERDLQRIEVRTEARSVTTAELLDIVAAAQTGARAEDAASLPDREDRPGWVTPPPPPPRAAPVLVRRPEAEYGKADGIWDDIVFQPVWDSRTGMLVHNVGLARRIVAGIAYYGRDALMGSRHRADHRALDLAVAVAARRGVEEICSEGGVAAVVVPVHYDTLATASQRMDYFALLQAVPEAMRRFVFVCVEAVPAGAPIGRMQEVFRSMRPFGAHVFVRLDYGASDLQRFENCGVGVVVADTPRRLNETPPGDADLAALADWTASVRLLKAETCLTGVESAELLQAGMGAGVRYFSGDLVAAEAARPAPARPLTAAAILSARREPDDPFQTAQA